ncbi:PREDICTED: myrosinase-binding protein-like At1g52030, partial [Galeopterus variegatus]|uniref:Myrosinase-binding protein-like At1g52030 n=1 Tax=Galeopterus variegatus TaxID=482537 RepID=A0ABM0QQT7_GALVR
METEAGKSLEVKEEFFKSQVVRDTHPCSGISEEQTKKIGEEKNFLQKFNDLQTPEFEKEGSLDPLAPELLSRGQQWGSGSASPGMQGEAAKRCIPHLVSSTEDAAPWFPTTYLAQFSLFFQGTPALSLVDNSSPSVAARSVVQVEGNMTWSKEAMNKRQRQLSALCLHHHCHHPEQPTSPPSPQSPPSPLSPPSPSSSSSPPSPSTPSPPSPSAPPSPP